MRLLFFNFGGEIVMMSLRKWSVVLLFAAVVGVGDVSAEDPHEGHSDIEFVRRNGRLEVLPTAEGFVFEGEFPLDGVDRQFTSEPGFGSELEEGLGIGAGAQVFYDVLEPLRFWKDGFQPVPEGVQIRIINQPPSPVVPDAVVTVTSGVTLGSVDPPRQRVGAAEESGDFHADLQFLLEPNLNPAAIPEAWFGAYGLKLSLMTDEVGVERSAPFYLVFNLGLEEESFEAGVAAYASQVPEPASAVLTAAGGLACLLWSRGRKAR
jgi:hypothetical protein